MAVEKLAHSEFAKIGSRQEALQTIFLSLLDICYHPIFDFFEKISERGVSRYGRCLAECYYRSGEEKAKEVPASSSL